MKIEPYEHPEVLLMLNGDCVLTIHNDVELARVQFNVAEEKLTGYSINFNGQDIQIDTDGQLSDWPRGMYDEWSMTICKIFRIRRDRFNEKSISSK